MDFVKKNKKYIIICVCILCLIGIIFGLITFFKNYNNYGSIKYKVYTKDSSSSYKKNGELLESKETIRGIKLVTGGKYDGLVYVTVSNKDESKICYGEEECILKNNIEQISMSLTDTLSKKYDIYYRIYFNDKWSKWSSNSDIVGEEDKTITKIQIRLVPKKAYLGDYLDGYEEEVMNNEK